MITVASKLSFIGTSMYVRMYVYIYHCKNLGLIQPTIVAVNVNFAVGNFSRYLRMK